MGVSGVDIIILVLEDGGFIEWRGFGGLFRVYILYIAGLFVRRVCSDGLIIFSFWMFSKMNFSFFFV